MDNYIGEIRIFSFNYAPTYWAFCDGTKVAIQQNPALASIIGSTYGGDNKTYFNLPNLQGLTPLGTGAGPGLTPRTLGKVTGSNTAPLSLAQMPSHNHPLTVNISTELTAKTATPAPTTTLTLPTYMGTTPPRNVRTFAPGTTTPNATLADQTVGNTGVGGVHENQQPYLNMNFCIALMGDYPVRP